jgi:ABC-type glycerol-3-phosphate transport system substrate-binding protein
VAGAAGLGAIALAACGQSGAAGPAPPAGEVRGTLDFMTNQAPAPFAAVEAAVASFRQQYPQLEGLWDGSRTAQEVATAIKAVTEPLLARHKELVGKDPPG